MKEPLILPILHHSDQSSTLLDLGIDSSLGSFNIEEVTFYCINAVSPYTEEGVEYCSIHANGSEYICTLSYNEVVNLINTVR